jgi:signal transduction histidine kinase
VRVELEVDAGERLPTPVEVAAYYVVSEALTNAAKHARATLLRVTVQNDGASLRLSVRDDGVGGADAGRGSGLIGLRDRVETVGGRMEITSPAGRGTSLLITIPLP